MAKGKVKIEKEREKIKGKKKGEKSYFPEQQVAQLMTHSLS